MSFHWHTVVLSITLHWKGITLKCQLFNEQRGDHNKEWVFCTPVNPSYPTWLRKCIFLILHEGNFFQSCSLPLPWKPTKTTKKADAHALANGDILWSAETSFWVVTYELVRALLGSVSNPVHYSLSCNCSLGEHCQDNLELSPRAQYTCTSCNNSLDSIVDTPVCSEEMHRTWL